MAVISVFAFVMCLMGIPSVRPRDHPGVTCSTRLDNGGLHITCDIKDVHPDSRCAFMREFEHQSQCRVPMIQTRLKVCRIPSYEHLCAIDEEFLAMERKCRPLEYNKDKLWVSLERRYLLGTLTCKVSVPEVISQQVCQTYRYRLMLYSHPGNLVHPDATYDDIAPNNCHKAEEQCLRTAVPWCGKPVVEPGIYPRPRVLGGQDAPRGAYPWMVSLHYENVHMRMCGGAIISERLILTAAHCFKNLRVLSRWVVTAGRHDLFLWDAYEQQVNIKSLTIHEDFIDYLTDDIALVTVDPPLRLTRHVRPICLPTADMAVIPGKECMFAGWGHVTFPFNPNQLPNPNVLQQVMLPVIPDSLCQQWYPNDFKPDKTFCAGYPGGVMDSCKGDSGGPLVCKSGDKWFIQGIISWGHQCGEPRKPGVYTDVSKHAVWLQEKISSLFNCDSYSISG